MTALPTDQIYLLPGCFFIIIIVIWLTFFLMAHITRHLGLNDCSAPTVLKFTITQSHPPDILRIEISINSLTWHGYGIMRT